MIGTIQARAAKAALCLALICPQVSLADGNTEKPFADWEEDAKRGFLQNSVIMASVVSAQIDATHGDCISDWFFDENGIRPTMYEDAVSQIERYADYRPTAVLVAMMEKACGPFGG